MALSVEYGSASWSAADALAAARASRCAWLGLGLGLGY